MTLCMKGKATKVDEKATKLIKLCVEQPVYRPVQGFELEALVYAHVLEVNKEEL